MLALRGARDWHRCESIELQDLEDHHIFPQAYLRRHGITKRTDMNSVTNRTLISDETNAKIKDEAPATYLERSDVFAADRADTLALHFVGPPAIELLRAAKEGLQPEQLAVLYEDFRASREASIVAEIQRLCC